jgi:hypothetical protein
LHDLALEHDRSERAAHLELDGLEQLQALGRIHPNQEPSLLELGFVVGDELRGIAVSNAKSHVGTEQTIAANFLRAP